MSDSQGVSLQFFMPKGERDGVRIIEKSDWTGKGIAFPRTHLYEARDRDEASSVGVYILWGKATASGMATVYIGESDEVAKRLDNHDRRGDKDFWTHSLIFASKDQSLNKAHVQHIEARLIEMAREFKRCSLENRNNPQLPPLSESDGAIAESFLSNLLFCLPFVGVDFFERSHVVTSNVDIGTKSKETPTNTEHSPIVIEREIASEIELSDGGGEVLSISRKEVVAHGYESGGKFVVKAGSQAVKHETPSARNNPKFKHIPNLRRDLIRKGVLKDAGVAYDFAKDYLFGSPGAASNTVLGASSNGLDVWKNKSGRSLGAIRKATVGIRETQSESPPTEPSSSDTHYLFLEHKGIQARGYVSEVGFVVTHGSEAVGDQDVTNSIPPPSRELRQKLIAKSIFKQQRNIYVLTEDCDLKSPSRAAGVLLGASYNGNKYWVDENDRPLGDIQT